MTISFLKPDNYWHYSIVDLEFLLLDMLRCRTSLLSVGFALLITQLTNNSLDHRYANRFLDATVVSMYLILQPVSTALMSLIFDINVNTSTSWSLWVSMVLIFIGLFITTGLEPSQEGKKGEKHSTSRMSAPLLEEGGISTSSTDSFTTTEAT